MLVFLQTLKVVLFCLNFLTNSFKSFIRRVQVQFRHLLLVLLVMFLVYKKVQSTLHV